MLISNATTCSYPLSSAQLFQTPLLQFCIKCLPDSSIQINHLPLSPVVPQSLVLKTPNIYDTGSAFILSATGFFSPKFRVGEGTEVCQCVYIFFQRYGLCDVGSGEGKGGGIICDRLQENRDNAAPFEKNFFALTELSASRY